LPDSLALLLLLLPGRSSSHSCHQCHYCVIPPAAPSQEISSSKLTRHELVRSGRTSSVSTRGFCFIHLLRFCRSCSRRMDRVSSVCLSRCVESRVHRSVQHTDRTHQHLHISLS
jgi:hypothetical protein